MEPLTVVTGRACPIDANDVDTDQIMPKQFLKRVERSGYGPFAFYDWRYDDHGDPDPSFPMNKPEHTGAPILLTGRNFGCGSSREHAPWGLQDAGFRVIVAPSFADIFAANCANIGLLCVALEETAVRGLFDLVDEDPSIELTVDLPSQVLRVADRGIEHHFDVDPHTKHRLLDGLDPIGLSLRHADDIAAHERARPSWRPTVPA